MYPYPVLCFCLVKGLQFYSTLSSLKHQCALHYFQSSQSYSHANGGTEPWTNRQRQGCHAIVPLLMVKMESDRPSAQGHNG